MKYENTFKQIDQILWKEPGCGSELDYLEQKSWMLFLKYLDDLETEREEEAVLDGKTYKRLTSELSGLFEQSHRLEDEIRKQLGSIGFTI